MNIKETERAERIAELRAQLHETNVRYVLLKKAIQVGTCSTRSRRTALEHTRDNLYAKRLMLIGKLRELGEEVE